MPSPQAAMPSRSWSVEPTADAQVGGAEITVSDDGVQISIDHARPERYRCDLEEYLTAVPLAGHSAMRDIVRRTLSDTEAREVADEVKMRLHGRPLRHVGEPSPRKSTTSWRGMLAVSVLLALAAAGLAVTIWR